jgi:hypothetical protein
MANSSFPSWFKSVRPRFFRASFRIPDHAVRLKRKTSFKSACA